MAKSSRFKQSYRKNASKLHVSVGDLLRSSDLFKNYRIYQEYPVNRISPYFDSGREKFDWVIMDLQVVIEAHGQQHYMPVRFGGITQEEAESKFQRQISRDTAKKEAAVRAGWTYVVFKYDEKVTLSSLLSKIEVAKDEQTVTKDPQEIRKQVKQKLIKPQNNEYHQKQLEKAREYRKRKYRELKRKKDENKRR